MRFGPAATHLARRAKPRSRGALSQQCRLSDLIPHPRALSWIARLVAQTSPGLAAMPSMLAGRRAGHVPSRASPLLRKSHNSCQVATSLPALWCANGARSEHSPNSGGHA